MTAYADASLIVAALSKEALSAKARIWVAHQAGPDLQISEWTITEVSSALAIKLRTGQFTLEQRATAKRLFDQLVAENLTVVQVSGFHFRKAAQFVEDHTLSLRAGDALHLAIAASTGATLYTLDRRLAEAGPALGIPTERLT